VPRFEIDVRFMADDSMLVFHDRQLARETTGEGEVASLRRADVAELRYREAHGAGLCFLEDVVEAMRGSRCLLQVDLKLMRPISPERRAALVAALRPLADRVLVGSQAHWNLRELGEIPVAFDPYLQWHYDPQRTVERVPRRRGVHGLWDDSPLAELRTDSGDYLRARMEDTLGLLPRAVEWMVDYPTLRHLRTLGLPLGEWLLERNVALSAWTVHEATLERQELVRELFELGAETIITTAPPVIAADSRTLSVV
jgi:glycerophosphoryl diester phosphodiesterase